VSDIGYLVEPVGLDYYLRQISCQTACPVHTDARGYVDAVARGEYEAGYTRARQPNPFASTCGRVCAAHCEKACRRGKVDAAVTIRALKRFLCESYGVEALSHIPVARGRSRGAGISLLRADTPGSASSAESFSQISEGRRQQDDEKQTDRARVAVVGAGPSGLTAAHDLALMGHSVTVFDAAPTGGGMLMLGIPGFRLPRDVLKLEIGETLDLGIDFRLDARLGRDFSLADLREQGFRAVFLAIGAHKDVELGIEGRDLDGVLPAVDFLLNMNVGYKTELGDRVVVIGGGDVAIDAARMATRLGDVYDLLAAGDLVTAVDAARHALRSGAREVHIVYRGTRSEMRASEEELEGALEEGTYLHNSLVPLRIVGAAGKVVGLETIASRSVYDENGRRTLETVPGSESVMACDSVILATGQESDLSFIGPDDGIEVSSRGTLIADAGTLQTTAAGIFAGGDVVYGPRTIIEAVADGHRAARGIDDFLRGGRSRVVRTGHLTRVPERNLPDPELRQVTRLNPPKITLDRRTGISEVELPYDESEARSQAQRCLRCHIQTVFNADLCILCGGCVDICPSNCLKLVPLSDIQWSAESDEAIRAGYGVAAGKDTGTAMIKDDTLCIRCGLCRKRCPTGAVTMEALEIEERLVFSEEQQ
jgi:NADPH-dependent glutamate synthase beta subunit-like oxidoreductase